MASNLNPIKFNENNQVKYIGIRPGYHGDQLTAYNVAAGATVTLYTVPADKILFVFQSWLVATSSGGGTMSGYMWLRDAGLTIQHWVHHVDDNTSGLVDRQELARFSPLELPEGWSLLVNSDNASFDVTGGIEGILQDA